MPETPAQYVVSGLRILSLQSAVEHWYAGWRPFRRNHMDLRTGNMVVSASEIPFWVNVVVEVVQSSTGKTFDYMEGTWVNK